MSRVLVLEFSDSSHLVLQQLRPIFEPSSQIQMMLWTERLLADGDGSREQRICLVQLALGVKNKGPYGGDSDDQKLCAEGRTLDNCAQILGSVVCSDLRVISTVPLLIKS